MSRNIFSERRKKILKMREQGMTLEVIGRQFKITKQRVCQIIGPEKKIKFKVDRRTKSLEERFFAKTDQYTYRPCWIWTGSRHSRGYGRIYTKIKNVGNYAHRLSWFIEYGPIPDGMQVCHKCHNPECVNPKHLFLCSRWIS